jgi:hypothetical protein
VYVLLDLIEAMVKLGANVQMKRLQEAAANKKKRSKKIIGLSVVCPETWEII